MKKYVSRHFITTGLDQHISKSIYIRFENTDRETDREGQRQQTHRDRDRNRDREIERENKTLEDTRHQDDIIILSYSQCNKRKTDDMCVPMHCATDTETDRQTDRQTDREKMRDWKTPGAGIMGADDRQVTTVFTLIPQSALDKPSIMKRYHRQ